MLKIVSSVLMLALITLLIATPVLAQVATEQDLNRLEQRVAALEDQVRNLAGRVVNLEQQPASAAEEGIPGSEVAAAIIVSLIVIAGFIAVEALRRGAIEFPRRGRELE
ncbi:MAG: hypothetical protein ACE5JP_12155 [Candidatus Bipolaricaulia bacterium]